MDYLRQKGRNESGEEHKAEQPQKSKNYDVELVYSLPGVHQSTVNVVRFSPNGQFLASGSDDGVVVLWSQRQRDVEFGKSEKKLAWACNKLLRGHSADVYDISWSSDSKFLVSCSMDGSAIIFSPSKRKGNSKIRRPQKNSTRMCYRPFNEIYNYIVCRSNSKSI